MDSNYYLAIVNWDNYDIIQKSNVYGVSNRFENTIYRTNVGDIIFFYIKTGKHNSSKVKSSVSQPFTVKSNPYYDESPLFQTVIERKDETYPYRIHLEDRRKHIDPKPFKPLVKKLGFISNKHRWGLTFMGRELIDLPKEDYITIRNYILE